MIFLHHADDYTANYLRVSPATALFDDVLTWAGLATLFTLAGFLTFGASTSDSPSGWRYFTRRFVRLYPPFALALLLAQAVGVFRLPAGAVLVNLALLGPWIGPDVGTLWFVELLIYFQTVFALWLALPRLRTRPWTIPLVLGLSTAGVAAFLWALGFPADARVATYLSGFAGGAIAGASLRFRSDPAKWRTSIAVGGLLSAASGVAVASMLIWPKLNVLDGMIALATAVAVVAVLLAPARSVPQPSRSRDVFRRLAYGSYMGYLVHRPVFQTIARVTSPLDDRAGWILVMAGIPLVFALGITLQRGYDAFLERVGASG